MRQKRRVRGLALNLGCADPRCLAFEFLNQLSEFLLGYAFVGHFELKRLWFEPAVKSQACRPKTRLHSAPFVLEKKINHGVPPRLGRAMRAIVRSSHRRPAPRRATTGLA